MTAAQRASWMESLHAHLDEEHTEAASSIHDFHGGVLLPESCVVCGREVTAQIHMIREDWSWLPS